MSLSNNYWFRYFAGAFLVGASIVAVAGATSRFKDLKIEAVSGRHVFTGASAWVIVGTILGIFGGIVGLSAGALKKRLEKA